MARVSRVLSCTEASESTSTRTLDILLASQTCLKIFVTVQEGYCELLDKLAELSLLIPITLVLDNARYQKCQLVRDYAERLGIELLYLPSYSPHLNLIERLWKLVRNECLYSKYYENFDNFKNAISDCLKTADIDKKQKLAKLLTWNFQSFKNVKFLAV